MLDVLNVVVDNDIIRTFANIFTIIVALDMFTCVAMIFGNAKNDV